MATSGQQIRETMVAAADLSTHQFKFVTLGASGVTLTGAGAAADGVVINNPTTGGAATVVVFGRVPVVASGTITAGANVASGANGTVAAATTGNVILGKATEAAVAGQVITVDFFKGGNASA